jgi:AcrR family transcriptional regulator
MEEAMQTTTLARRPGRPRCDETRHAILRAAFELLEEGGLARFTIEGVAARSGAAKTTIYRWWPSKGALAMESYLTEVEALAPISESESAVADLRRLMRLTAQAFASEAGRILAGLVAEGQSDPDTLASYREKVFEPRRAAVGRILRRGIDTGELRADLDLDATLDAFYAPFFLRLLLKYAPPDDSFADRLADTVLRGIEAPGAAQRSDPPRPIPAREKPFA